MSLDVTVVVAAYNTEQYIERCVASLLAADVAQVIVVDDASLDGTSVVAEKCFGADARVRIERMAFNVGPSAARNRGFDLALASWVAIVDSDDWCAPERFRVLIKLAETQDADMVSDDQYVIEDGLTRHWTTINRLSSWSHPVDVPVSFQKFVASRQIVKPMIRRAFWKESGVRFRDDFRHAEDMLFFSELLLAGARWHMSPLAYYYYTIRSASLTGSSAFAIDATRAVQTLVSLRAVREDPALLEAATRAVHDNERQEQVRVLRTMILRRDHRGVLSILRRNPSLFARLAVREAEILPARVRRRWTRATSDRSAVSPW